MSQIKILDKLTKRYLDALYVVLLRSSDQSLLPELYDIFGKELLIKFLDVFAGMQFRVPSREILERAVRDVDIYIRMSDVRNSEVLEDLSTRHNISKDDVTRIFNDTKTYCEDVLHLKIEK